MASSAPPVIIPNPLPSIEQQFRAIHDDGDRSNEGIIRTKLTQDGLARVSFVKSAVSLITTAPSAVAFAAGTDGVNPDGSLTEVTLVAAPGAPNGSWVEFYVTGRVVGISFVKYSGSAPFDVLIDGAAYAIDDVNWQYKGVNSALFEPTVWIVADDLPDGVHKVSVMMSADPLALVSNRVRILGFLAERRCGYRDGYSMQVPLSGSVPTASALISNALTTGAVRSLRKIDYLNTTTGAAILVTVKYNSVVVWSQSVPANGMLTYDLGDQTVWDGTTSTFSHLAAATGVTYSAYGRI